MNCPEITAILGILAGVFAGFVVGLIIGEERMKNKLRKTPGRK